MTPIVDARGLVKTYGERTANPVHALRGVDLTIPPNGFFSVMGHSGCGKSTLLNILGCLDRPTAGAYRLNGADVSHLSRRELARVRARTLGFIFQNFNLLPRLTALANVELALLYAGGLNRRERRARAAEALVRVGLHDKLQRRPSELSGGQQQRVAVARAIVNRPALLLADEPTGNLDTHTGLEIMALLQDLHASGLTLVVVTHDAEVAAHTRWTLTMRDGQIVHSAAQGTPLDALAELRNLLAESAGASTATGGAR